MFEENTLSIDEINNWLEEYRSSNDDKTKKKLKELVVLACMPIVKKVARSLARRSTDPVEDITQVGSLGLIKAVDLYNPEISKNFKSYATYLITGEIRHYLRDKTTIIRAPREIKELSFRVHKLTLELTEKLGKVPTDKDIAEALQMPQEKVEECNNLERRTTTISIDQIIGTDDNSISLAEKIEDESQSDAFNSYENRIILDDAIKMLEPLEQQLIIMNYYDGLNQREISEKLNISQMQVSRKLKKSIQKLFEIVSKKGLKNYE
ncbi:MAG: sigma-70 family RNA polymerase sigma factor [Candidatus Gastranaerophilales bacterium]|nr:sigma-70 family RNA polymerase sigma factor [Candidatus Gastranaerophilales bacterium]